MGLARWGDPQPGGIRLSVNMSDRAVIATLHSRQPCFHFAHFRAFLLAMKVAEEAGQGEWKPVSVVMRVGRAELERSWPFGVRSAAREAAMSYLNNPKHWRERAEEARVKAEQFWNESEKQRMLRIAEEYDRLAERAADRLGPNEQLFRHQQLTSNE